MAKMIECSVVLNDKFSGGVGIVFRHYDSATEKDIVEPFSIPLEEAEKFAGKVRVAVAGARFLTTLLRGVTLTSKGTVVEGATLLACNIYPPGTK